MNEQTDEEIRRKLKAEQPGEDMRCLWNELITGKFFWKWAWCSWAHHMVWTMTNKGERIRTGGRCHPHVWHDDVCRYWHCTVCRPCDEGLDSLFGKK